MEIDEVQFKLSAERRRRKYIVAIAVPGIAGAVLLILGWNPPEQLARRFEFFETSLPLLMGLFLLTFAGIGTAMAYLQGGFDLERSLHVEMINPSDYDSDLTSLRKQLDSMTESARERVTHLSAQIKDMNDELQSAKAGLVGLPEDEKAALVSSLKDQLKDAATGEFLAELKQQVGLQQRVENQLAATRTRMAQTLDRLVTELEALSRRGNLNLSIGVATTIIGLAILGYFVLQLSYSSTEPWAFAVHFVPRLTLVIFIEVFAYFFLSLYRSSLAEIKYIQNEITTVESKFLALQVATLGNKEETMQEVISKLAATERNFILNKGQTTIELEKARLDKDTVTSLAKNLADVFSKKPG